MTRKHLRKPIRCMRETKVREIFQKGKNFENKDLLLIFSEVEQDSKQEEVILKNDRIRSISWKLKLWYINENQDKVGK